MDPRKLIPTALLGLTVGCGGGVDVVPTGPHRLDSQQLPVEEPPPPAKVETIPERPSEECLWLDGRWEHDAVGWQWQPGAWVVPAEDCYFARSSTAWATGTRGDILYFRPGEWVHETPPGACPEPRRCETRRVVVDQQ